MFAVDMRSADRLSHLLDAASVRVPQEGEGTDGVKVCEGLTQLEVVGYPGGHSSSELLPPLCLKGQGKTVSTRTQKGLQLVVEIHPHSF